VEAKAERITAQELKRAGWSEQDLIERRKGDPKKIKIALRLRKETTMTLSWIAHRLHMGTKTHLSHLLYWQGRRKMIVNDTKNCDPFFACEPEGTVAR